MCYNLSVFWARCVMEGSQDARQGRRAVPDLGRERRVSDLASREHTLSVSLHHLLVARFTVGIIVVNGVEYAAKLLPAPKSFSELSRIPTTAKSRDL